MELKIRLKRAQAVRLKKHLAKEHPMTKGKMSIGARERENSREDRYERCVLKVKEHKKRNPFAICRHSIYKKGGKR